MPGFWRIFYTLLLEINENKPIRNFNFQMKEHGETENDFFSEITTKALFKFYFP